MTTMISNLPSVLIEEIFARVPLKFLRAVRLTCQSWNSLSTSESFTKMYIGKAATREEESMMVAMMNHDLYFMRVVDDVDPYIECKRRPNFLDEQVKIARVFHCEGLLLCIFEDDDSKVVVWNPYLGQTRSIKNRYSHRQEGWIKNRFNHALGYEKNESCRTLKFLRFIDYYYNEPEIQFFWYEIYDFDSGLWKTLDVSPHWRIMFGNHGVSLKGNTYWPAKERNSQDGYVDHIICFDFTREKFGPLLPLPSGVRDLEYEYVSLSCVREEKLAALVGVRKPQYNSKKKKKLAALFQHDQSNYYELEIWITTKIDVEIVSWSKFLKLDTRPDRYVTQICEGFIIEEEKKVVMGFKECYHRTFSIIGAAGDSRKVELGVSLDPYIRPYVCSYVPSLVRIKELERGNRKRESSSEKSGFDQYKLRLAEFENAGGQKKKRG